LQDEYNQAIADCDAFVALFRTKTGKYTEEEFDVAWRTFRKTGRPLIYTYFQKATVSTSRDNRHDLCSLWDFQDRIETLGHFFTEYESIDGLQRHFRDQLDRLVGSSQTVKKGLNACRGFAPAITEGLRGVVCAGLPKSSRTLI